MKKLFISILAFGLFSILALAVSAMHHEVKITEKAGIGKYLSDTEGMTLYWFKKDNTGQSACTGGCINNWPVFYREKVAPPDNLSADDFGTITREDGAKQTTFRGYPLYYFKGDAKAGDTNGNGLMDVWSVIEPENFPR